MQFVLSSDGFGSNPVVTCGLAALFGVCVGSFLNVVALRSLKEQSFLWPPSHCFSCEHRLSPLDNIPVLSYLMLGGKCRYCKATISFQYPLVEIGTAIAFAVVAFVFLVLKIPYEPSASSDLYTSIARGISSVSNGMPTPGEMEAWRKLGLAGMMFFFTATLIAVTVTDFREKLIPHEITYPAMTIGIICSAIFRGDLLGTMAGIGASYIIFDFLAFYGLKFYMLMHPAEDEGEIDDLENSSDGSLTEIEEPEPPEEQLEVMGGGDAVLSAVMSAYLGWQLLVVALIVGFAVGTIGGLVLLLVEMKKAGLLPRCIRRTAILAGTCGLVFGVGITTLKLYLQTQGGYDIYDQDSIKAILLMTGVGALGGGLLGMVSVGTQVSKPFPFGPALAAGGLVAMFLIPFFIPFTF